MAAPATTHPAVAGTGAGVKPIIGVPFYSMYGHIATLAEEVIAGVEAAGGIARPFFIEETLPAEVLQKMHAGASLNPKYPLLQPNDLTEMDGFIFGIPTRYGRAPAQVSSFFDKTGGLWASQALNGKYAATFTSTASQHGGQELTHMTTLPFFVHHGCVYVPIGYKEPYLSDNSEVHGASPWGVSTVANGDGSRVPTEGEKRVARFQGEHFTKIVAQAVRGRHLLESDARGGVGAGTTAAHTSTTAAAQPGTTGTTGSGAGTAAGTALAGGATGAAVTGAARQEVTKPNIAETEVVEKTVTDTGPAAPTAKDGTTTTATKDGPATAATGAPTVPAGGTGASAPSGAAGARPGANAPAAAPQKKSGGLFSCCSGNSID